MQQSSEVAVTVVDALHIEDIRVGDGVLVAAVSSYQTSLGSKRQDIRAEAWSWLVPSISKSDMQTELPSMSHSAMALVAKFDLAFSRWGQQLTPCKYLLR